MGPRLIPALLIVLTSAGLWAQDAPFTEIPGLKEKALILEIVARVIERNETEAWSTENTKVTIPGRAVIIKLVGKNVIVLAQFTPYQREDGKTFLVAQGQVWIDTPQQGLKYQSTIQTIPINYGEQVLFFPLGNQTKEGQAQIEIQLELRPFDKGNTPQEGQERQDTKSGDTNK
jgi:hypothetical protein